LLSQAATFRNIEISVKEQSEFTRLLRDEFETRDIKAAENPAAVILKILDHRLTAIKEAAITVLSTGRRLIEDGKRLLAFGRDPGDEFDLLVDQERPDEIIGYKELLRRHFPVGEGQEQGLANLLAVVVNRYGSLVPVVGDTRLSRFVAKRAYEYGGNLQAYLTPSVQTVSAVLTLYLLASGANVSVGRTLYKTSLEPSEEPKHTKITGYKPRAGGKPIFATLEDRSEAVVGMRWLIDIFDAILPSGCDQDQLFRAKVISQFSGISEWTYRAEFKNLTAGIPGLEALNLTPRMIRPSILLKAALESDGRTLLSQAIG